MHVDVDELVDTMVTKVAASRAQVMTIRRSRDHYPLVSEVTDNTVVACESKLIT